MIFGAAARWDVRISLVSVVRAGSVDSTRKCIVVPLILELAHVRTPCYFALAFEYSSIRAFF